MTPTYRSPDAQMMQFILGKWVSRPVHTAAELGIADLLADGPRHVDAGGGLGDLLIRILERYPSLHGTVAEREELLPGIHANIARHGLSNRMSCASCDILTAIPSSGDGIILSHVLHDWPDEECLRILQSCRSALPEHGVLIIAEAVIPPRNEFSPAKLLDLEVLIMGGGKERNEEEFRSLLTRGGFTIDSMTPISPELAVIRASH